MDITLVERERDLLTGLAGELAAVVSALLGSNAKPVPAAGAVVAGWVIACTLSGPLAGRLTLAIGEADAADLARRLMGMTEDPDEAAIADAMSEVAGQAAGGLAQQAVAGGCRIRVDGMPARGAALPPAAPTTFDIAMDDGSSLRFACWADLDEPEHAAVPQKAPEPAPAAVAVPTPSAPGTPANLDVILDIELPLTVRFGRTEMTMQALTRIGPGSVIDLDRSPDEPVEVLINDKVIARGEVVVVAGNYGVRITEVVSAADRIRTLGS